MNFTESRTQCKECYSSEQRQSTKFPRTEIPAGLSKETIMVIVCKFKEIHCNKVKVKVI